VNRSSLIAAVIAVLIVGVLIGGGLYWTRNNRLELKGEVLKVRSYSIDQDYTVAVIDFRATNPSTAQFVVKDIDVTLNTREGKELDGAIFSEIDARRLFDYYKVLGTKFNPTLISKDKVESGQTVDKMLAVRFTGTDADIQNRKALHIMIHDVDGVTTEIQERRP
jgi:hypothetical protein